MKPEKDILDKINNLKDIGDIEGFLKENPNILLYKITCDLNNLENTEWQDYKQVIRAEKIKKLNG